MRIDQPSARRLLPTHFASSLHGQVQVKSSLMGKRKVKNRTLTKIDPSILESKPVAISQHAATNGARITTAINPVCPPPLPPVNFLAFDLDSPFNEEHLEDDGGEEEDSGGHHVARVRPCAHIQFSRLTLTSIIRSSYGGMNVTYISKSLFGSKVEESPLMTVANSAATRASSVVLIASRFSSSVEAV
jgi:hypothetical protein